MCAGGLHYGDEGLEVTQLTILLIQCCITGFQSHCLYLHASLPFCLCSCSPHCSNPLLSPQCAGTPSNYLTTALKQTNICLEAGPDPATAFLLRAHQPRQLNPLLPEPDEGPRCQWHAQPPRELHVRAQTVAGAASKYFLRFSVCGLRVVNREIRVFLDCISILGALVSSPCFPLSTCQSCAGRTVDSPQVWISVSGHLYSKRFVALSRWPVVHSSQPTILIVLCAAKNVTHYTVNSAVNPTSFIQDLLHPHNLEIGFAFNLVRI